MGVLRQNCASPHLECGPRRRRAMNNTHSAHADGPSPHRAAPRPRSARPHGPARRDYASLAGWVTVIVGLAVIGSAFILV